MTVVRFRLEQRFSAPLLAVEEAFVEPELLAHLGQLPDLGRPQLLEQTSDGGTVRQRVRYKFQGQLSSAVTSVIDPERLTWVEDSTLDRATHVTEFVILPDHYSDRLRCLGRVTLDEDSGATTRITEGDLRVRAVFVAGRVERAIIAGLHDHAGAQAAAVQAWLG